jgi:hypothetical protein
MLSNSGLCLEQRPIRGEILLKDTEMIIKETMETESIKFSKKIYNDTAFSLYDYIGSEL